MLQPAAAHALQRFNFRRVDASVAKNSADTRLVIAAIRLQQQGYDYFFVVTGDEDFIDLAQEIEPPGTCFLCPVDPERLRGPMQDWPRKVFIRDLISLKEGTPPRADDLDQFVLCLQRIVDDGSHFGNWQIALSMLVERFNLGGMDAVSALWTEAKHRNLISEGKVEINGEMANRRRLTYESPDVNRLLQATDLVLEEIERRHGSANHGDLISAIPSDVATEYAALPEMLTKVGYLTKVGDDFALATPLAGFGTLRPLKRIALSTWHQCLKRPAWEGVGPSIIDRRWVRHAFRGARDIPADKERLALDEGRLMIKRAVAAGVLIPVGGGNTKRPFGYKVQSGHPLVSQTIAAAQFVWSLLPAGFETVPRTTVLDEMRDASSSHLFLGSLRTDHMFWLGAMASEGIINMFQGNVQRNRNAAL